MTWTWWFRFRNQHRLAELSIQIGVLTEEVRRLYREQSELTEKHERTISDLTRERDKRIIVEALSVERSRTVEHLETEIRYLREQNDRIVNERLKSLDSLNLKLMEPRVEPLPPDFAKMREERESLQHTATQQASAQMISRVRSFHNAMDLAILGKLHPGALRQSAPARPMNEPLPADEVVPNGSAA